MKRLLLTSLIAVILPITSFAQQWDDIKADTRNYLSGEGRGETVDEANQQALAALISQLCVVVSSNFEILESETREGNKDEHSKY